MDPFNDTITQVIAPTSDMPTILVTFFLTLLAMVLPGIQHND